MVEQEGRRVSEASVFISYAEADRAACERVVACLRDAGADVWCAPHGLPVAAPDRRTRHAELGGRTIFVVLLSEAAYESPWIERECRLAVVLARALPQRRVVPLVVHPTHYIGTWEFLDGIPRVQLYDIPLPLLAERILTPPVAPPNVPPQDLPLVDDVEEGPATARGYRGLARAEAANVIPAPERGSDGRLTREMVSVLKRAGAKAQDRQHPTVEPSHLLFGMVSCPTAGALEVIAACGVQPARVLAQLHLALPMGGYPLQAAVQLSPRSRRVIELAVVEARVLGHHYIGTIQALLAILAQGGETARLLVDQGLTHAAARAAAAHLLLGSMPR